MQKLNIVWPDLPAGVGVLSTLRSGGVSVGSYGAFGGHEGEGVSVTDAARASGAANSAEGSRVDPNDHCHGGLNLGLHVGDDPVAVETNRRLLRAHVPAEPAWLTQVHGTRVIDLSVAPCGAEPYEADASIASQPGQVCTIMSADCLPVLLADVRGLQVGAAHAGWRGLAQGVIGQTVAAMRAAGADQLTAWLGPAIGPQAFEVGSEVRHAFAHLGPQAGSAFVPVPGKPDKFLADLPALARLALLKAGVTQVWGGTDCTFSNATNFYSFRRDQITGRMASLIWIK